MILFVCGFLLGISIPTYYFYKRGLKIQQRLRAYSIAILSLNVSHLHDAANLFDLLRNSINSQESFTKVKAFVRGSAYHFRSIFDELKSNISALESVELSDSLISKLYSKELIDLKDLLELELFQISNWDQIEIRDSTNSESAHVLGNFQLLSKAILNLVENSLKYSETTSILELLDSGAYWGLKIITKGKPLPDSVLAKLNTGKLYSSPLNWFNGQNSCRQIGHGLSSLIDIMEFHNASIDTLSLDCGNIIQIYLPKHSNQRSSDLDLCFQAKSQFSARDLRSNSWFYLWLIAILILFTWLISLYLQLQSLKPEQLLPRAQALDLNKPKTRSLSANPPSPSLVSPPKPSSSRAESKLDDLIEQANQNLDLSLDL